MAMNVRAAAVSALLAALLAPAASRAAVIRFDVASNVSPALQGQAFGARGAAQKIVARATIAVDPRNPSNGIIADLAAAPRDAQGRVEAETDVIILRPAKPNGAMVVDMPNRGGGQFLGLVDDTDNAHAQRLLQADDAGNGFLLEQGFTLVLIGWQGDLKAPDQLAVRVPVAKGLTGRSREQWNLNDGAGVSRLKLSYPAAAAPDAKLYWRPRPDAPAATVPGLTFKLVDDSTVEITRPKTAAKGTYEFVYTARDPAVMGLGFAALRDVASFLRHDTTSANPLAAGGKPSIDRAIATGISQTGRALRDVLYLGFNQDEAGRPVFDAMLPIIPGTRRSFTDARFAQPGRNAGPEADQGYPMDQFPFTYATQTDALTGKSDGLLARCDASRTCPKIIEVDSEYEFYGSRASLLVTDTKGAPASLPDNVRAFMMAGSPHSNRAGAVSTTDARCKLASSPVYYGPVLRALLLDLDQWVKNGTAPPPSRYPNLKDGTLVPPAKAYPAGLPIPYREQYLRAHLVRQTADLPMIAGDYPVLLPKAGPDGNAIGGVRLPIVAAPRASYTGWNPQSAFNGPQDLCDHAAGMTPFAATRAERLAAKDTRPSLEELYPTPAAYVAAVRAAADELVGARLLLRADADAMIREAEALR